MTDQEGKLPTLFIIAWILVIAGTFCLGTIILFQSVEAVMKGMGLLGTACISFGIGEILNHPKEKRFIPEEQRIPGKTFYRRRRNICALGNLLLILGLLLFFVGLAKLF